MIGAKRFGKKLAAGYGTDIDLGPEPSKAEIRDAVKQLKREEGLCGRRIGEQRLGPYFISGDDYGQRELDLLDEAIETEYAGSDLCIQTRRSECSRLRGGCKGNQ
ncbi:uncharacterized protein NP_3174A [Natronomonas pharaonis DSM 2160]|uniref:Uncharacterized protein n=1 Tax=Natronomonas pharaonis (strain ATCC 35678 / DSM 2160 / CIP 103997 / JCM 8858 / NBRC 14720 / NCIMB 2260 / Gabara) TaxID=348780 RepID=A0A1U7EX30_NATPD|nr:hypothetical protein [Natronomonas pharaonis]CAI49678.1 uncharacterized protein NP_3174A [Natronomonas pharaonis DSM 2160]